MKLKRLLSVLLAVVLVVSCAVVASSVVATGANKDIVTTSAYEDMLAQTSADNGYGLSSTINDGTILQAWTWSFKNIEANLETIAEQGFTTVQVSPPNEIKAATKGAKFEQGDNGWWMFYQPAGFQLNESADNALGTKAEFVSMCTKAHELGLKIIVDTVINHMGTNGYENDDQSSSFDKNPINHVTDRAKEFEPEIYNNNLFHSPYKNMQYLERDVSQYDSTYDLTRNCTSHLPDLKTEDSRVQNAIYDYMDELLTAGADGFRFDAAKHIETPDDISSLRSDFWKNTLTKVRAAHPEKEGYAYGEILNTCGVNRPYSMYFKFFEVTDNCAHRDQIMPAVRNGAGNGNATPFYNDNGNSAFTKANTVLWEESHDTYVDGTTTSLNVVQRGKIWALTAGRAGFTTVYLARPDDGTSTNALKNITLGDAKKTSWSNATTKAINQFHNYFIGQSEYCTANQSGNAYIERGTTGAVIVRCGSATTGAVTLTNHKLKAGTYTDAITGAKFTVTASQIKGNVGNTGVAVIYYDEVKPTEPPTQKPTEAPQPTDPPTEAPTVFGQGKLMGDTDEDDSVTIYDATLIQRVRADLAQPTTYYNVVGDVDQDNEVTVLDATAIQRFLADLKLDEKAKINVRVGGSVTPEQPTTPYVQPTDSPIIIPTDPVYPTNPVEDPTYPDDPSYPHRDGCYTIIFSNSQGWTGSMCLYYWKTGEEGPNPWPGEAMEFYDTNEFGQAQYFGFVPMDYDNYIINGSGGTVQTADCSVSGDIGVWPDTLNPEGKWEVGTWDL
ncbi:MAG: starch-binding protein [Ruminococcus sp.]|nr:starch-binding protein [Ruminococcus sp.]